LGGVNSDGDATCSGCKVITGQSTLPSLIQAPVGVEGERMGWYYETGTKF
jgi:hypothetical protein